MYPGKFITLEGAEGVGKSSNILFIKDYLESRGLPVITTREPGGTALGESVRSILLDQGQVDYKAELLLLFAARAQHVSDVIIPALKSGVWVISDRFVEASYAYQGGGRGIPVEIIQYLENWVLDAVRPDCTILLDAPPEIGMTRARTRGTLDRIEREDVAFFQRVRQAYLERARQSSGATIIVDATRILAEVQATIRIHLDILAGI